MTDQNIVSAASISDRFFDSHQDLQQTDGVSVFGKFFVIDAAGEINEKAPQKERYQTRNSCDICR